MVRAAAIAFVFVLSVAPSWCHGQALILRTATLNALGESVGMYAERVDMATGRVSTPPIHLPGKHAIGPPLDLSREGIVLFGTVDQTIPRSYVTACRARFFDEAVAFDRVSPRNSDVVARALVESAQADGQRFLVQALRTHDHEGQFQTIGVTSDGWGTPSSISLPGVPIAMTIQRALGRAIILCEDVSGNAVITIRDVLAGRTLLAEATITPSDGRFGNPRGIAIQDDGATIAIATSGYAAGDDSNVWSTWIHVHDGINGTRLASPLELPGHLGENDSLVVRGDTLWVVTHDPSRGEGYVSSVAIGADGLTLTMRHTVPAPRHAPLMAHDPAGTDVLIASMKRLELLESGTPRGLVRQFENSIGAIHWQGAMLFVGVGNSVHRVEIPSLGTRDEVSVQSGIVDAITIGIDNESVARDSDGDGIHDGRDLRIAEKSPLLEVPRTITLHAEAIGQELRGVRIQSDYSEGYRWRVAYDRERLPWLALAPQSGVGPGAFYAGIDPSLWDGASEPIRSVIRVTLEDERGRATGSPALIALEILPARNSIRRILWLDPARTMAEVRAEKAPFAEFATRLSQGPEYFSQRTSGAAGLDDLGSYTVVIAPASSLIDSGISRAQLLDYVIDGGALLFVGDYGAASNVIGVLDSWLAPAGITLDMSKSAEELVSLASRDPLAADWVPVRMRNGLFLHVQSPARGIVPAPDGEKHVVAVAQYGRGRIGAIASSEIITAPRYDRGEGAFAIGLLNWLARARVDTRDTDGDGLPDDVEDRDGDGFVDPGESDFINPDTDRDGVPDHEEDRNASGTTDDGETSALNRDSDSDGIWDGADTTPLPARGAPRIDSVRPSSGPAEGGQTVLIRGSNFSPDCGVAFGEAAAFIIRVQSPETILVEVPPAPRNGPVSIRIENPSTAMGGALPEAYSYGLRSEVAFSLQPLGPQRFAVRLDVPEGARVGRVACRIDPAPGSRVRWVNTVEGGLANVARREVVGTPEADGTLQLRWTDGRDIPSSGVLATLYIEADEEPALQIGWAAAWAPSGIPLRVRQE